MEFLYVFLDAVAGLLVVFLWIYCIRIYKKLPEKIPTHFDPDNQPDAFGSKKWIFFYAVLGLIFFVGFHFILKYPETFNFPVEITPENQERQYTIALVGMRLLLIFVLLIFLNILDYSIRKGIDSEAKPKVTFATVIIGWLIFIGILIVTANKFG